MLKFQPKENKTFELIMHVRTTDDDGNIIPTGKMKYYATDDASKLAEFWNINSQIARKKYKKKKKRKTDKLPSGNEAAKIMESINQYAEGLQKERQ